MPMDTTRAGWTELICTLNRNMTCFIVQESHQLKGQEGEHLHHHLLIVAYLCLLETQHSPSQLPCPVEEGSALKFSQAPGSRLQWLNSEESRGPRAQAESLWKGQHWESPSSLETRIYLDQNIPSTITKIKQKYHSSSRSGSLRRIGNQWAGQLLRAPLPIRALLISLSRTQMVHYFLHSQMLVTTFRLDSSLCQQRLPGHSSGN